CARTPPRSRRTGAARPPSGGVTPRSTVRTTTRQHSHPAQDSTETARRVGRAEDRLRPCGGAVDYETRHLGRGYGAGDQPGRTAQVASASNGGRSSSSGFFVMSTGPPVEPGDEE